MDGHQSGVRSLRDGFPETLVDGFDNAGRGREIRLPKLQIQNRRRSDGWRRAFHQRATGDASDGWMVHGLGVARSSCGEASCHDGTLGDGVDLPVRTAERSNE